MNYQEHYNQLQITKFTKLIIILFFNFRRQRWVWKPVWICQRKDKIEIRNFWIFENTGGAIHQRKSTQAFDVEGTNCVLYYKCFTIVIYNRNDSGQYYKTTITIVIDDPS
jgi:hypothetical protein